MVVQDGSVVTLDIVVRDADGTERARREGATVLVGGDPLMPGVHLAIAGRAAGTTCTVELPAGTFHEACAADTATLHLPRLLFPPTAIVHTGQKLVTHDVDGNLRPLFVHAIDPHTVVVGSDHPWAELSLHAEVSIAAVRPPTPGELALGCLDVRPAGTFP